MERTPEPRRVPRPGAAPPDTSERRYTYACWSFNIRVRRGRAGSQSSGGPGRSVTQKLTQERQTLLGERVGICGQRAPDGRGPRNRFDSIGEGLDHHAAVIADLLQRAGESVPVQLAAAR